MGDTLASEKHDDSFRVVDRRLFTAEGELRQEIAEQEEKERARQEKVEAQKVQPSPPGSPPQAGSATPAPVADAPRPSRSFQMLIDMLARNAALFLGGYADPATGRAMVDLDSARELIDMMEVLREKTKGNLAAEDDKLLTEVLSALKLSYLEVSKAAAQAMREGAPASARPNPRAKP
jgi:hypothetical protein